MIVNKSCRANFVVDDKTYIITNSTYKRTYSNTNGKVKDIYLENLFHRAKVLHQLNFDIDKEHIPYNLKIKYITKNIKPTVLLIETTTEAHIRLATTSVTNALSFICPKPLDSVADSSLDFIETEIQYLNSIHASRFYEYHTDYVILPNVYQNPITETITHSYTNIKNSGIDIINSFLYNLRFVIIFPEYQLNSVTYDELLGLEIKEKVIDFYQKNFYGEDKKMDSSMIELNVNTTSKNNHLIVHFTLFNYYGEQHYTSFIEYHTLMKYEMFLEMKHQNINIIYDRINTNNDRIDDYCKENYLYQIYRKYQQYIPTSPELSYRTTKYDHLPLINQVLKSFLGIGDHNIDIIYYFGISEGIYSYCSSTIVCNIDGIFYEIVLKDVTFDYLSSNDTVRNDYLLLLQKYLSMYHYYAVLPQFMELMIQPINKPAMLRIQSIETSVQYHQIESHIKQNALIDPSIVLSYIIQSGYGSIKEIIIDNILFDFYFTNTFDFQIPEVQDFFITNKKTLTNPKDMFTLWYFHKVKINDELSFENQLSSIMLQYNQQTLIFFKKHLDIIIASIKKNSTYGDELIVWMITFMDSYDPLIRAAEIIFVRNFITECYRFFYSKIGLYFPKSRYQNAYMVDHYDQFYYELLIKTKKINIELFELAKVVFQKNIYALIITDLDAYARKRDHSLHDLIINETDFYSNFQSDYFIKNVRDLKLSHKKQIDILLEKFFMNFYEYSIQHSRIGIKRKLQEILKYPYFIYAHYPNSLNYAVFHLHLVTNKYGSEGTYRMDVLYNYYGPYIDRLFLWEYIKYIDYSKSDLLLTYTRYNSDIKMVTKELQSFITETGRPITIDFESYQKKVAEANNPTYFN